MTSSVATSESAPHTAVAYIVPAGHSKRVRSVAADGQEEEADENPWVHMQLKDPFQQTATGDGDAADTTAADQAAAAAPGGVGGGGRSEDKEGEKEKAAEELPKPEAVIKEFAAAKGELEWLMAMFHTLQEGRYLTVGRSERNVGGLQRLADLAVQANSRWRRRATAAAAASAALAEGAAALRALGEQEDAFYSQVTQLQRYWKVWQEPPSSPSAYSVNLSLASTADASSSSSGGSSSAAAAGPESAEMVGRGPVQTLYILKDPSRNLRVQVPAAKTLGRPTVTFKSEEQPPQVYTGPAAIHALLLQQLRLNAWHMVVDSLDEEICSILNLPAHLRSFSAAAQQWHGRQQQQVGLPKQQQQQHSLPLNGTQQQQPQQQQPQQPQQQQQQQSRQPQQQQASNFAASGHFTLYASLSSLVLQAVAGAAGTAGEAALLQHQQQQQQGQGRQQGQGQQQQHDAMVVDSPGAADGFSLLDVIGDVARPWQHAAATAAARGDPSSSRAWATANASTTGGSNAGGSDGGRSDGGGSSSSSSLVPRVCVEPQLLSMRPLALEHLLITQLGHLVASLRHTSEVQFMAPIAYAAASRQMRERVRQRLQQHHGSSRGANETAAAAAAAAITAAGAGAAGLGQLGLKPGSLKFGSQASFLHCFARWLKHAAHRDLLRGQLDGVLQRHQGLVARQLSPTHSCVSAMQVLRSPLPAAAPAAPAVPAAGAEAAAAEAAAQGSAAQQQLRQTQLAVLAASKAAVAPSLLLLLSDAQLVIESTGSVGMAAAAAAAAAAADAGASRAAGLDSTRHTGELHGVPPTQSALSVQLQALPRVLEQLLQQL